MPARFPHTHTRPLPLPPLPPAPAPPQQPTPLSLLQHNLLKLRISYLHPALLGRKSHQNYKYKSVVLHYCSIVLAHFSSPKELNKNKNKKTLYTSRQNFLPEPTVPRELPTPPVSSKLHQVYNGLSANFLCFPQGATRIGQCCTAKHKRPPRFYSSFFHV